MSSRKPAADWDAPRWKLWDCRDGFVEEWPAGMAVRAAKSRNRGEEFTRFVAVPPVGAFVWARINQAQRVCEVVKIQRHKAGARMEPLLHLKWEGPTEKDHVSIVPAASVLPA